MNTLNSKQIIIIGGSSGIGFKIAEMAAEHGAILILVGRNSQRLEKAEEELSKKTTVSSYLLDAHNHNSLEHFFNSVGTFDHIISMVGDVMGGGFVNAEMETIRRVMESKFFTNVYIGQLAAKKISKGGSMVFTSGTGGRAQHACASYVGNLGINALVEGLAAELAPNVRVNAVSPTWTLTPFWRDVPASQVESTQKHFAEVIPLKRTASIDEIASAYIFLMSNGFITGQHLAVDGGIMLGN